MPSRTSCLVIGGRGFVGSALAACAQQRGLAVSAVGRDDYDSAVGARFDIVVFAAGNARRYAAELDPVADLDQSVASVYRALRDFSCDRFVLVSSVDVYADPSRIESTREEAPIDPLALSTYGFHKRLAELAVMRSAGRWLIVRLAQMVGPGLRKGPVFDVLARAPLRVSPRSRYPLLRTRTAAEITFALLDAGVARAAVNVCARDSVTLERVLAVLGCDPIVSAGAREERYSIDTCAARAVCEVPSAEDEALAFASSLSC